MDQVGGKSRSATARYVDFDPSSEAGGAGMHRRKAILLLLAACGFVLPAVGTLRAQQDEPQAQSPSEAVTFLRDGINSIKLTEQASRILEHSARIKSVDGHDPKVLDVQALSTTQIRMHGLATGVTDLIVTDEFDKRFTVEVFVAGDVRHLKTLIKRLYPQSSIDVIEVKGSVILNGWMTQPEQINEVVAIAENFYDKVLNHMKVGGVQQVMLECQILEVQRSKMRRFGVNFLLNGEDANFASTVGSLAGITGGGLGGNGEVQPNGGSIAAVLAVRAFAHLEGIAATLHVHYGTAKVTEPDEGALEFFVIGPGLRIDGAAVRCVGSVRQLELGATRGRKGSVAGGYAARETQVHMKGARGVAELHQDTSQARGPIRSLGEPTARGEDHALRDARKRDGVKVPTRVERRLGLGSRGACHRIGLQREGNVGGTARWNVAAVGAVPEQAR